MILLIYCRVLLTLFAYLSDLGACILCGYYWQWQWVISCMVFSLL